MQCLILRVSELFETFWTCLSPFGPFRFHSGRFRTTLDPFRESWTIRENFETFCVGQVRAILNHVPDRLLDPEKVSESNFVARLNDFEQF